MQTKVVRSFLTLVAGLALLCGTALPALAQSAAKKPNILVIGAMTLASTTSAPTTSA
jgi:hypothetical protein